MLDPDATKTYARSCGRWWRGKQFGEAPDAAKAVAGAEGGLGVQEHVAGGVAAEGRAAGQKPGVVLEAEGTGKFAAVRREHFHFPSARRGAGFLLLDGIGTDDDESGVFFDVRNDAVESVGPHRAIRTAKAHVMHDDQGRLVAEQIGHGDGSAVPIGQRMVFDEPWRALFLQFLNLSLQRENLFLQLDDFFAVRILDESVHAQTLLIAGWMDGLVAAENETPENTRGLRMAAAICHGAKVLENLPGGRAGPAVMGFAWGRYLGTSLTWPQLLQVRRSSLP